MATAVVPAADTDLDLGMGPGRVIALMGPDSGRYPYGNSLLVVGTEESILIDPSLAVAERGGAPSRVDRILVSHAHEDHLAGVSTFPDAAVHSHHDDLLALHSLDGLLEVYGMPEPTNAEWGRQVVEEFHYAPRIDATGFSGGQHFELGGVSVEVIHLPGHTRGHCGFLIEPDGVFFVADIDLSAFGPYYGDHWSDLEDYVRAIDRCREIEARSYVTFHHKGIVHGRSEFTRQLDAFDAVIGVREQRLLTFLSEPRTMADIVRHRFIYRPTVELLFADHVERRSATLHLARLTRTGAVREVEPGRWQAE
jgi:hydroxyacylglutathione hydrolase